MPSTNSIENVILNNPELADHPLLGDFVLEYQTALENGHEPPTELLTEMFVTLVEIAPEDPSLAQTLADLETVIVEEVVLRDEDLESNSALADMLNFYASIIEAGYTPDDSTVDAFLEALDGVSTSDPALQDAINAVTAELSPAIPAEPYNILSIGTTGGTRIISVGVDGALSEVAFAPNNGTFAYGTALGDINGDGLDDLLMTGDNNFAFIYYADGAGGYVDSGERFAGQFQGRAAIADIDNDGDGDIYLQNGLGDTEVWRNDPSGFVQTLSYDNVSSDGIYRTANNGEFGDVNGDGFVDLLIQNVDVNVPVSDAIFINDGAGNFSQSLNALPTGLGFANAALGDVNGDGALDYVRGTTTGVAVAINDGNGNFSSTVSDYGAVFNGTVSLADVNGDGKLDAIRQDPAVSDGVALWLGDGVDGFVFEKTITTDDLGFTQDIYLGDFSGDGIADISYAHNGGIKTLVNDGEGTFSEGDFLALSGFIFDGDIGIA